MSNSNTMATQTTSRPTTTTTIQVCPQPVLRLSAPSGTLRLRAEPAEQRHIQWAEDVVDNEGMGKKSSKVCCIYHKPRAVGESSDESSSDSSSDSESDSEPDNSTARPIGGRRGGKQRGRRPHRHNHDHPHDGPSDQSKPSRRVHRKPSPNAYEKMPKRK
ncbi:phosphatase inhibitor-domain-containing protein [Dendryphion nanum]|uniref:Type 1 phosphatases regulator n=1 Tax=Dendryphion nanum TaxID=256645 RepID=A0A9P9IMC6_9PLEO|nr:phosphatase inhibitor-domain-containing protein [Dendryphion nanum]